MPLATDLAPNPGSCVVKKVCPTYCASAEKAFWVGIVLKETWTQCFYWESTVVGRGEKDAKCHVLHHFLSLGVVGKDVVCVLSWYSLMPSSAWMGWGFCWIWRYPIRHCIGTCWAQRGVYIAPKLSLAGWSQDLCSRMLVVGCCSMGFGRELHLL